MTLIASSIIAGDTLAKLIAGALAAGVAVTLAFSLLIYSVDRASELRRCSHRARAAAFHAASALALAACLAIVSYGLILTTSKPK